MPPRSFAALLKEKIPLFFICVVDAAITMIAQHAGSGAVGPYTLPVRFGNALVSYARYVRLAFWPTDLAILYLHPLKSLQWWQIAAAALFLLAISALVYVQRGHRYLVVGWLWFLGTLVPMIGVIQVYLQAMADRYAYVSFIGLFLMVCWSVADWAEQRRFPRAVLPATSAAILLVLAVVSHRQIQYWHDDITLWTHTLQVTHHNWVAETYLAMALRAQGQPEAALAHYYRALPDMTRRDPEVYLGIATGEQQRGNPAQAIEFYKKALVVVDIPDVRKQIFWNMGIAYRDLGDSASAQECFYQSRHQPPVAVDWQGDWWRQIMPILRERLRHWRSGPPGEPIVRRNPRLGQLPTIFDAAYYPRISIFRRSGGSCTVFPRRTFAPRSALFRKARPAKVSCDWRDFRVAVAGFQFQVQPAWPRLPGARQVFRQHAGSRRTFTGADGTRFPSSYRSRPRECQLLRWTDSATAAWSAVSMTRSSPPRATATILSSFAKATRRSAVKFKARPCRGKPSRPRQVLGARSFVVKL